MTEGWPVGESLPGGEASVEKIVELLDLIQRKIETEGDWYVPGKGGFGLWPIDHEDNESFGLSFRVPDSDAPFIVDYLTFEEVPDAVAHYNYSYERFPTQQNPYSRLAEVKQVWILEKEGQLSIRKRLHSHESPVRSRVEALDKTDQLAVLDQINERREAAASNQARIDAEEAAVGLNRLTDEEVDELLKLIQGASKAA